MSKYQKSWTTAMQEVQESAALQLKMAFDDAGIKIKGTKGGKLVIAKKDEKKVEKIIAKQMKKPSDAKRVLGSQIIFEEIELVEKEVAVPSSIENLKQIVKDKQNAVFMFKDGKVRVDLFSASALMGVYNALKPATRKKFETMIKTKGGFMKSAEFAFKMAKEEVDPHAKVMAKKGDSPEKIKDMHPEITDDELEKLFKEEFNIKPEIPKFSQFLKEGRPSLDPDYVPSATLTDKMRAKLLSTQKKLYSSKDIESMARKYKQKLVGDPVGGKSWGGDWEIVLRNGVSLSYEYGPNSTYIKGWKFDRKAIQNYIGKYANEHETPRDYAPMGGKVLVGGLEAAFEVISEAAGFHNYPKRNKVGDEIEKLASKGGAEADKLFVIATALQKGRIPNKFIKELSPKRKKEVHAIMKDFKWKELPEEVEIDEVFNVGKMSDKKLKDFIGKFDPDERMGQAAAMQLKAARKEARKRGMKLEEVEFVEEVDANEKLVYKFKIKPKKVKKMKDLRLLFHPMSTLKSQNLY